MSRRPGVEMRSLHVGVIFKWDMLGAGGQSRILRGISTASIYGYVHIGLLTMRASWICLHLVDVREDSVNVWLAEANGSG